MEKAFIFHWFEVPIIVFVGGLILLKHPPKSINSIWGYRTRRSSQNITTWNFAQNVCGKYFIKASIIMLIPTIILAILTGTDAISQDPTVWIMVFQLLLLLSGIPYTEYQLRKHF